MAITLGKDCSVSIGGNVVGVRSAQLTMKSVMVEVTQPFANVTEVINCGYDAVCTVELNDANSIGTFVSTMQSGSVLSVSGGSAGISFTGPITGISNSFGIDGVETFSVEAKQGISKT